MSQKPSIPRLFDQTAQRRNRARAAAGFSGFDFLKLEAAIRIADRLELMRRDFPLCLDFGSHDGTLTGVIFIGMLYNGAMHHDDDHGADHGGDHAEEAGGDHAEEAGGGDH